MFDASTFMSAFEAHGMALRAYRVQVPYDEGFVVGFVQPEQLILGDAVQTSQLEIEYASADAPALVGGSVLSLNDQLSLALGTELLIDETYYRINQPPRKLGDGTFSRASVEVSRA